MTIKRGQPQGSGSSFQLFPTSIVRKSFHRRAGIREIVDPSGLYKFRTVEIKRNYGESIGFYIRQGDGWKKESGIFVSRVNLGSVVDVNDLLHVGEEIVKVNGFDITDMPLNKVVSLVQKKRNMLCLTIKLPTSETVLQAFSANQKVLRSCESNTAALQNASVEIKSTPEVNRPKSQLHIDEMSAALWLQSSDQVSMSTHKEADEEQSAIQSVSSIDNGIATSNKELSLSSTYSNTSLTLDDGSSESSLPPTPPTSPVPELEESDFNDESPVPVFEGYDYVHESPNTPSIKKLIM